MSDQAETAAARQVMGTKALWALLALIAGLGAGVMVNGLGDGVREPALQAASLIGNLWLDALKMTVIPLIVALLVTGVAQGAEAARAGRLAGRAILWFVIICTVSAILAAVVMPLLLQAFPLGSAPARPAGKCPQSSTSFAISFPTMSCRPRRTAKFCRWSCSP
jgi:Na+/H+-dicarboxylate symporter